MRAEMALLSQINGGTLKPSGPLTGFGGRN